MGEEAKIKAQSPSPSVAESLTKAIQNAEELLVRGSVDPCLSNVVTALKDKQVQEHFIKHISDSEVFRTAYCLNGISIPEQSRIIFEFSCVMPKICLVSPRFSVNLNVITGKVEQIEDPVPPVIPVGEQAPGLMYRLY